MSQNGNVTIEIDGKQVSVPTEDRQSMVTPLKWGHRWPKN